MKRAALLVGVNRYEDEEIVPLQYAERDAAELYGFLKHQAGYDAAQLFSRLGEPARGTPLIAMRIGSRLFTQELPLLQTDQDKEEAKGGIPMLEKYPAAVRL